MNINKIYRPTWAEIDLEAARYNLGCIRETLSSGVNVMAVVKANAYGHGICQISKVLVEEGVDYLGVATVDEAMKIRTAGVDAPILILGSVLDEEARIAVENNITLTLCDSNLLNILKDIYRTEGKRPKVHIKIDTGMGRIGVWHEDAMDFIEEISSCEEIDNEGIYTHFSSAGRDKLVTQMQIECFENILENAEKQGITLSTNMRPTVSRLLPGRILISILSVRVYCFMACIQKKIFAGVSILNR